MENSSNNENDKGVGKNRTGGSKENANTGDWDDQRDDARTDGEGYDEESENDNTGGAGSTGSAATNS